MMPVITFSDLLGMFIWGVVVVVGAIVSTAIYVVMLWLKDRKK